jgi:haloalkane dehalogenase
MSPHNPFIQHVEPAPESLGDGSEEIRETPSGVAFVRTPDACFEDLPDYAFAPNYLEIDGLRMHYVDEGPRDGEIVLMLHGQPTWSYLYRKMIVPVAEAGFRVIAPDMIGLGKSDKPIDQRFHRYLRHVEFTERLMDALALKDVTSFIQDWGSCIGLRLAGLHPERFRRVMMANGAFPDQDGKGMGFSVPETVTLDPDGPSFPEFAAKMMQLAREQGFESMFQAWIEHTLTSGNFRAGDMVNASCGFSLAPEVAAAYSAPFPQLIYNAGPRSLPAMAAGIVGVNQEAWQGLARFEKPFAYVAGERDAQFGTKERQQEYVDHIPGSKGQNHARVDAGHFIQEMAGEKMAELLLRFIADNPA